jgi:two-component system nitrogen regulation sensor histidine kinase NtrY
MRNRFRALTVLQVLLLVGTITLLAFTVLATNFLAAPIVIGIVITLQILGLIAFVEAHVDSLEDFFAAINYEDFTRRFVEDDVDAELKLAFNKILDRFQEARAQRDVQANYLETVVQHVPVPFIAARSDGSLSLVNNPARRLTGLPALRHINDLGHLDPSLPVAMQKIETGQQQLLQTRLRTIPVELRVSVSEIRMEGETERLYSIENLSGELTARESSAWRNLIRVLTHEIMNTLTPVTSLAQTTQSMLDDPAATDDIREAITTIARRSEGLMQFVSKYRELLHVPSPNPQQVPVSNVFGGVATLLRDQLAGIAVSTEVTPESLEVFADPNLLDQVILNLVKNAIDALANIDEPSLSLSAGLDYGRTLLRVRDNGRGIPPEDMDQIFVPFFTTKRDGSGIGLSLSRQIMTAHGGDIAVESDAMGTTVSLLF